MTDAYPTIGDCFWLKLKGFPRWPAKVCDPKDGGKEVQSERKANKVLLHSFGDHMYIWASQDALAPFEIADGEAAQKKASGKLKAALAQALGVPPPQPQPRVAGEGRGGRRGAEARRAGRVVVVRRARAEARARRRRHQRRRRHDRQHRRRAGGGDDGARRRGGRRARRRRRVVGRRARGRRRRC